MLALAAAAAVVFDVPILGNGIFGVPVPDPVEVCRACLLFGAFVEEEEEGLGTIGSDEVVDLAGGRVVFSLFFDADLSYGDFSECLAVGVLVVPGFDGSAFELGDDRAGAALASLVSPGAFGPVRVFVLYLVVMAVISVRFAILCKPIVRLEDLVVLLVLLTCRFNPPDRIPGIDVISLVPFTSND